MLFFGTQVWYKEACHRKPCNHLLDQLPSIVERTVALVHVGCLFNASELPTVFGTGTFLGVRKRPPPSNT